MRRHKVIVVYKSGAKIKVRCKSFTVTRDPIAREVREVTWIKAKPKPLLAGIDEIAAVWQVRSIGGAPARFDSGPPKERLGPFSWLA